MAVNKQLQDRALDLGFFPVALDFSEPCWEIIEQHEGFRPLSSLWLRHVPDVGDEMVFKLDRGFYYRGRVAKRAFEASDVLLQTEMHNADTYRFCVGVHLWIDQVVICSHPDSGSVWDEWSADEYGGVV